MNESVWVQNIEAVELKEVPQLDGKWRRIVDLSAGRGLIFVVGRIEPGQVADWHAHPEDEVFLVFKGRGIVRWKLDDREYEAEVGPGSAFFKMGGILHRMEPLGDEPLFGVGCKV